MWNTLSHMTETIVPVIMAAFMLPLFFIGMPLVSAVLSGWLILAKLYPCDREFHGKKWYFQRLVMRWSSFSSTIGANQDAIYLCPTLWFWHPPLLIPFDETNAEEQTYMLSTNVLIRLNKYPSLSFQVTTKQAKRFETTTNGQWSYERL